MSHGQNDDDTFSKGWTYETLSNDRASPETLDIFQVHHIQDGIVIEHRG